MAELISAHDSVRTMYQEVHAAGADNVVDRYQAQGNRCGFCTQGLSCQLCSNGPCRIIPGRADRGVCGIDAAGMVMRNLLHKDNMGLAAYTHHAREAARTLRATALGQTPFSIKDPAKLDLLASALGVTETDRSARGVQVADRVIASLAQGSEEESVMVTAFAPESRRQVWRHLGILPGGPLNELMDATARAMTNIDGDYVSLALTALRLGLASCYGALVPLEIIQDALFGTPMPHRAEVDLGVIDPDYVNIVPNGHEPFLGAALIDLAHQPHMQELARQAGARGLRIVGSIETGQELMQRYPADDVFVGLTGNWLNQEFALATGGVDLFAMDMNCSVPSLAGIAEKYGTTLVSVSHLVGVPGTKHKLAYRPEQAAAQACQLIDLALENFRIRRGRPARRDLRKVAIMTGFSNEACLAALGGSLQPLLEMIGSGAIKGVVALVSCTSLKNGGQDVVTVQVARELIKRDMLVLAAGCGNAACQVAGLNSLEAQALAGKGLAGVCQQLGVPPVLSFGTCTDVGRLLLLVSAVAEAAGVDPSQLPVAVTAPEYMEQKATIDAFGAVAFGLYTHVSPLPPVTGSPEVVKLLTQDVEQLTGGKLAVETEPQAAVDGIEAHLQAKRAALGM